MDLYHHFVNYTTRPYDFFKQVVFMKLTKNEIIDEDLESCRYHEMMCLLSAQYDRLQSNKKAWCEELQERQELDGVLMDGLEMNYSESALFELCNADHHSSEESGQ